MRRVRSRYVPAVRHETASGMPCRSNSRLCVLVQFPVLPLNPRHKMGPVQMYIADVLRTLRRVTTSWANLAGHASRINSRACTRVLIDLPERAAACRSRPSTPCGSVSPRGGRRRRLVPGIVDWFAPPSDWLISRAHDFVFCRWETASVLRSGRLRRRPRVRTVAGCCQGLVPTEEAPTLAAPWTRTAAPGPPCTLCAPSAAGATARKRRDAGSAAFQTAGALARSALAGPWWRSPRLRHSWVTSLFPSPSSRQRFAWYAGLVIVGTNVPPGDRWERHAPGVFQVHVYGRQVFTGLSRSSPVRLARCSTRYDRDVTRRLGLNAKWKRKNRASPLRAPISGAPARRPRFPRLRRTAESPHCIYPRKSCSGSWGLQIRLSRTGVVNLR